jgi:hypothetical protein
MPNYHNIEHSGFRHGEYVGYGRNTWWRIKRHDKDWRAWSQTGTVTIITKSTLAEISKELDRNA